jgi:YXWGXW repeat-containing protein
MRKLIRPVLIALTVAAAVTAGGIGIAAAQPEAIPPLRAEGPPPPPPGPHSVWEPGHWVWTGRHFDWVGGHYITRARGLRGAFVPGHWARRGGGWVWVPEHWR